MKEIISVCYSWKFDCFYNKIDLYLLHIFNVLLYDSECGFCFNIKNNKIDKCPLSCKISMQSLNNALHRHIHIA